MKGESILGLMKWILYFTPVLFLTYGWSGFSAEQNCTKKDLYLKNCVLRSGELKMSLSNEKIRYNHDMWTSIVNFPNSGIVTRWEEVKLYTLAGRHFLSLKVWEKEDNEIPIEELRWVILEPKGKKLVERVNELLGKRQEKNSKEEDLIQDRLKDTSFALEKKSKRIVWSAGKKSGVITDGL